MTSRYRPRAENLLIQVTGFMSAGRQSVFPSKRPHMCDVCFACIVLLLFEMQGLGLVQEISEFQHGTLTKTTLRTRTHGWLMVRFVCVSHSQRKYPSLL